MGDVIAQAAAEAARQRVHRASGQLRQATRDLASLTDGVTAQVIHIRHADALPGAYDRIAADQALYGGVDLVVIARPQGRGASTKAR